MLLLEVIRFYFSLKQNSCNILSLQIWYRVLGMFHAMVHLCFPLCGICNLVILSLVTGIVLLLWVTLRECNNFNVNWKPYMLYLLTLLMLLLILNWGISFMNFGSKIKRIGGNALGCNGFKKGIEILASFTYQQFNEDNEIVPIVFNQIQMAGWNRKLIFKLWFKIFFKVFLRRVICKVVIRFYLWYPF